MITSILYGPEALLRTFKPAANTVLIAIRDAGRPPLSTNGVLCDELHLEFDDIEQGAGFGSEALFTPTQAKQVNDFLTRHMSSKKPVRLLVVCKYGVSRSAAISHWAGRRVRINPWGVADSGSGENANRHVLHLLRQAHAAEA